MAQVHLTGLAPHFGIIIEPIIRVQKLPAAGPKSPEQVDLFHLAANACSVDIAWWQSPPAPI